MTEVKPASVQGARDFFADELRTALERQRVSAEPDSVHYLTDLLLHYMKSDEFFAKGADGKLENNVLAHLYAGYLQGDMVTKKASLKRLGDICLLITGLFPDSLRRKIVDIDYYFGMGGLAYGQLAHFQFSALTRTLFDELSKKFIPFSNVLGEMSEKSGLQSNRDLLRLYERWLLTGNDRLKKLLNEKGIAAPIAVDTKVKH